MQNIVFGPILSRRFGLSLGVDLSPSRKQCNFDCLYCELGGAKTIKQMIEVVSLESVLTEIRRGLELYPNVDVLSITASGEPTLYPFLLELSSILKTMNLSCKTLILSNGSRFGEEEVAKALRNFDIVKFSLDCVSQKCFRRLDRPHKELGLDKILEGIQTFARSYDGELVAEVLVLKGLNDEIEEMRAIARFLGDIRVARVDLGSIDRPPAYEVDGVNFEKLEVLASAFEGLCVSIPTRKRSSPCIQTLGSTKDLLEILARRPIAENELESLFGEESREWVDQLFKMDQICIKNVANMRFLVLKP